MKKPQSTPKTPEQIVRDCLKSPLACDLVKKIQSTVTTTKPEKNNGKSGA